MAFSYTCLTLQRAVIPVVLALTALFRPVGISFVYLLMFFISPFIPIASTRNFKGSVTPYLIILIALSTILLLCHLTLQGIIFSLKPPGFDGSCDFTEQLLRHVGFVDFRKLKTLDIVKWLLPEVIVFLTSLSVYLVTKKLTTVPPPTAQMENGQHVPGVGENPAESITADGTLANEIREPSITAGTVVAAPTASPPAEAVSKESPNFDGLVRISPFFCLTTLFFAGILRPSVPAGFYFLIFLLSGSYWATFQTLKRGFAILLRFVMVILVLHIIFVVSYQTPWMQQHFDSKTLAARLLSLEPLITSGCANDIRVIEYNARYQGDSFLSPIFILICYYTLALTTINLIHPRIVTKPFIAFGQQLENGSNKCNHHQFSLTTAATARGSKKESRSKSQRLNVSIRREQQQRSVATEPTETTPLVRSTPRKSRLSRAESIAPGAPSHTSEIAMDNLGDAHRRHDDEATASICDQISYGIVSVGGFIYQNSYIFTNILMMAWSIVYHSWLTFVLLLWANVLWMIPNQRKAMMRSSPFIVIYAELLLVAQYIYGMDLNNDELPSKVDTTGINLGQIGLERPQEHGQQPCVPLIVKTAFLLMFWVTLRQFFKEKSGDVQPDAEMMGPLQLSRSVADTVSRSGNKKTSKFLKRVGGIIKNLLVRLWIWLLVLVIFLCATAGKQMNGFRICYMALFLFFLLVFQSSSKAWLKVMYGFWLFLIFYAMSILILIYTYQFDKFDQYWSYYLNISKTLQTDIGLERFKTKELFLHLVSPTIIVILTVIQVHYFHKRFIESLINQSVSPTKSHDRRRSVASLSSARMLGTEQPFNKSLLGLIRVSFKKLMHQSRRVFKNFKGVFWRLLELHMIKLVYITAFVCSIKEVCVLHIPFISLCVFGLISRSRVQVFFSRFISLVVTIIILAKMIYQIAYLDHNRYNVDCPNINASHDSNNAVWFGLQKASEATGGLIGLLRKYIVYMVVVTLHAVITLRQFQMRSIHGKQNDPVPKVLFPNVQREDAEKNLEGMTKYLFNYGFYKFGFEISLITLAATITYRQDIVAVAYAFWLLVLLWFGRWNCRRIWSIFEIFIAVSIILQYILFVGLPPMLCVQYPWENISYSDSIQIWALLPGGLHISHSSKLIFDFILLLMVDRQKRVFNIEFRFENSDNYPGGTNKSVVKDIAQLGQVRFHNPTRDFLSNIRNYLDVFKNGILCGFYWITLAVVFLAGTNISDLLALGYLVGAFVFLWQGSDFYLRPIDVILKRWNWLIAYNVANIVAKTCLQMAGCMFLHELTQHCCWLVHMLGITCVGKATLEQSSEDEIFASNECPTITTHVVLVWDTVCFAFLIFQLRIFKSHYFCHIISDTQANSILASRGAELIEDLRQKQIEHRQEHEKMVLYKIKRKMEKIRATQQKMLRPIDRPTHFDDGDQESERQDHQAPLADYSSFSSFSRQDANDFTPEDDTLYDNGNRSDFDDASHGDRDGGNHGDRDGSHSEREDGNVKEKKSSDNKSIVAQSVVELRSLSELEKDRAQKFNLTHLIPPSSTSNDSRMQSHTPSSDVLTMPFDGFLDTDRSSLNSAPNSDIMRPLQSDSEELLAVSPTYAKHGYPIPGSKAHKRKEIKLHPQAVRAGDYYMFDDMDEKFELDLIEDEDDFLDDKIAEDEKKMTRRKNVIDETDKSKQPSTSKQAQIARSVAKEKPKDDTGSVEVAKSTDDVDSTDEEIKENPIIRLLEGFLVSLTIRLNRFSRNYRYVNKILAEEKNILKESRNFMRLGRSVTTALIKNKSSHENDDSSSVTTTSSNNAPLNNVENASNIQTHHTNQNNSNTSTTNTTNVPSQTQTPLDQPQHQPEHDQQHVVDIIETPVDTVDAKYASRDESEAETSVQRGQNFEGVPEIRILAPSLNPSLGGAYSWGKQCSHEKVDSTNDFNFEDDFTSRDHHILIEVLISSWYAILSNTDLICYIVVFINQVVNASIISLPLPIMVFLWGTLSLPRPTKTFWVTLIAYTQAIVLIKCIFQFKLIWANYNNLPNQPLAPEKIIGVELDANYASYDLLLLLVLFLHRFVLKSQGLWKSEYKDEIMEDALISKYEFEVKDDDPGFEEPNSQNGENTAMVPSHSQNTDDDTTHRSQGSMETDEYIRGISKLKRSKYFSSLRKFFFNLLKKTRLPTDVYALMFLCDFINFFVLLFGFTAFGSQQTEGDGGVQTYLAENKVPVPFLIMLLLQFILLVIDRALYLRKSLFYKIIFHFFSVIGIHIWMFFVVPAVTERSFYSLAPPIIFYIIKCFYLLFSSYQIKCGYPKRILGNFLTRSFSLPNMISFKVYMIIPFLYELRTILDWVCTHTTMTLFDWLKMEDIFADIFFIKCSRQMETDFPAIRAEKKAFISKLLMGGTVILLIVICIWGPLCLFALGNAVGQSNVPYEIYTSIRIGPYDPIYQTNNRESIYIFDDSKYATMQNAYKKDKSAITFLSSYDASDIAAIGLAGNSPSLWSISPPDMERLLADLKNGVPLIARFTYSLTRIPPAKGLIGTVRSEVTYTINETFAGREAMISMLEHTSEEELVVIPNLLPKFIKVLNSGDMGIVNALMPKDQVYRPLVIKMKSLPGTNELWWEIREFCDDNFYTNTLSKLPLSNCDSGIVMYTFNDKKFPSTFSFLTAGGIIGLYTTFVLLASRILKSFIAGQNRKIMFEDLPYVDRVLQLCLDIYLVREALEFTLEEDLFAKLIFLYRSPETMIKWTRPKEETNDDETDTDSVLSRRRIEQL